LISEYPKTRFSATDKNRKVIIEMDMAEMRLTKLQRARLIQLLGPRYKNRPLFRIQCEAFGSWQENLVKVLEMAKELYWEAKRAP